MKPTDSSNLTGGMQPDPQAVMRILLAEMQALAGLIPCHAPPERTEAEIEAIDAEIEAAFDNMPV